MISPHRPSLRDVRRLVAAGIALLFVLSAMSLAYAVGRHSSRAEPSPQSAAMTRSVR
jgi:hypothetical protein